MDQSGSFSINAAPQGAESPESPNSPQNRVENFSRFGVQNPRGKGLESSSEDKYEEPSSEERNNDDLPVDKDPPVEENPPVQFVYIDDCIRVASFKLYTRWDVSFNL